MEIENGAGLFIIKRRIIKKVLRFPQKEASHSEISHQIEAD
jgi:hypothetical protein